MTEPAAEPAAARHYWARLLIYVSISVLSLTTIYGTFFVTSLFHQTKQNREDIDSLVVRMVSREAEAKTYIPIFLSVKTIAEAHEDLLKRIMDRQRHINELLEKLPRLK